VVLYKKPDIV